MLKKLNSSLGHWLLLLTLSIVWGSSFILIKRGLEVFSFEQVAALRLFIAFSFLSIIGRKFYYSIPKKKLLPLFLTGFIGNGIPAFLFAKSGTYLDSGLIGILNVLTPLFTLIIGLLFYRLNVNRENFYGIAIGMIGTIFLLYPEVEVLNKKAIIYCIMVICATACYGWSTNIIKVYLQDLSAIQITTLTFSFLGPWAGVYLYFSDFGIIMQENPIAWKSMGYIAILAIFGSALSVIVFNRLVQMTGTLFATSCTYLIPIVAILWGVLDKEAITTHHLIGFLIIASGIYLVNKRN
jgi:drug/metabolite transporter (DMT)-like permease